MLSDKIADLESDCFLKLHLYLQIHKKKKDQSTVADQYTIFLLENKIGKHIYPDE